VHIFAKVYALPWRGQVNLAQRRVRLGLLMTRTQGHQRLVGIRLCCAGCDASR
jgi:hypothetical protein